MKTLLLGLLIFVIFIGSSEMILSQPAIKNQLPPQNFGTDYDPLEEYILKLEVFAAEHDDIECIIVGSSMSRAAIHPMYFSQGYERHTGEPLACFNVGINGLTASGAGPLAQYIADRFHPELLIFATSFRDYDLDQELYPEEVALPHSDWVTYRGGDFSVDGWLLNNANLYRYLRAMPRILKRGWGQSISERYDTTAAGFSPIPGYMPYQSPTLSMVAPNAYPLESLEDEGFLLSTADVDGLRQIIALSEDDMNLIVIEMPAYFSPEEWQAASTQADKTGWRVLSTFIAPYTRSRGIPFWTTSELGLISDMGWYDRVHMFSAETPAFSIWLGEQFGAATAMGLFEEHPPAELLNGPPLDILPSDPNPERQTRLGLSAARFAEFQDYRRGFDLIPDGTTVFIPEHDLLPRDFLRNSLGEYVEWFYQFSRYTYAYDDAEFDAVVAQNLDLMILLGEMQYEEELNLDAVQQAAFVDWQNTKLPEDLRASGVDYLLYSDLWFTWIGEENIPNITNPDNYELVASFTHVAVNVEFYLYRVLGG